MTGRSVLLFRTLVLLPLLATTASCEQSPQDAVASEGDDQSEWVEVDPATVQPIEAAARDLPEPGPSGVREIEWDDLIPEDYRPDLIMSKYNIDELTDDDPRAVELMAELQALWNEAPVRPELDGESIKLPGFVVPVEGDDRETTGFLLVPYYGACIHVPPPPANQTVYVLTEEGKGAPPGLFEVVWVTGTVQAKRVKSELAEAGYTLYATGVEPYE